MDRLKVRIRVLAVVLVFALPFSAQAQIRITLNNKFIEEYQDRVLIETDFTVKKAHAKPNPPSKDGDLHIAGNSKDVGLPVVAEMMNAKFEKEAMEIIHDAEDSGQPVHMKGVWRFWCEHAGGLAQVQGGQFPPIKNTNPDHVFEIHPITHVDKVNVLRSLKPIKGYKPKEAERAFHRYQSTQFEIRPGAKTTQLITTAVGFNYVEFKMLLHEDEEEGGTKVKDGRLVMAEVHDMDDDLRARRVRMVFAKGSEPEKRVRTLRHGQSMHVLGIPRMSLKLIQWRIDHARKNKDEADVLKWHLPYEIIVVGVYDDDDDARFPTFPRALGRTLGTLRLDTFSRLTHHALPRRAS